tara:strand:- start:2727 stop:3047 length:321 start_codon:yes stop_codon:yes gene_type:complete
MSSLAREFNQENLVVVKKIDFKFIEEEIQKGSFGLEAKNSDFKGDRAASIRKTEDGKILTVEHYESKEEGGLAVVNKVDQEIYEKFEKIKVERKSQIERRKRLRRF